MKSGGRNDVDTFMYEYTVIIALICMRQKNIPFVQRTLSQSDGQSDNQSDAGSGDRT